MTKRLLAISISLTAVAFAASAQKEYREMQFSESEILSLEPSAYVKPLVAEVSVDTRKGRIRDTWHLNNVELKARLLDRTDASIENLQAYGVFKSSEKHNCDIIVAATFDVRIDNSGANITVVGYPANYANWSTSTVKDYEWINGGKGYTQQPATDKPITPPTTPQSSKKK